MSERTPLSDGLALTTAEGDQGRPKVFLGTCPGANLYIETDNLPALRRLRDRISEVLNKCA